MVQKKLTNATIRSLPTPKTGRAEYPDDLVPGLKVRVSSRGAKSWTFRFRVDGQQRRMTLGSYPILGLADARELARGHLIKVGAGTDPIAEKQLAEEALEIAEREAVTLSVESVIDEFIQKFCVEQKENKGVDETRRVFDIDVIPFWGGRDIRSIAKSDVIELRDKVFERGSPVQSNRFLSQMNTFLGWCSSEDKIDFNVAREVKKRGRETRRERVLSDDELKAIWIACEKLPLPFGQYVRTLTLTAARRSEIANLERDEIMASACLLALPKEKTKTGVTYEVPAGPMAQAIIASLPLHNGRYVFSTTSGRRPISGFSKAKAELDRLSGVENWTYHDLRRTADTRMNEMGVKPHVVSAVLSHKVQGIEGVYNHASYRPEKIAAIKRWEAHIKRVLSGKSGKSGKVVAIR